MMLNRGVIGLRSHQPSATAILWLSMKPQRSPFSAMLIAASTPIRRSRARGRYDSRQGPQRPAGVL